MKVTTIRSTPEPERLACITARGDYFDGFVDDVNYDELMEGVPTKEKHRAEAVADPDTYYDDTRMRDEPPEESELTDEQLTVARTRSLLERLFRKGHFGPLEHPSITIAIKGISRVTMAQLTRHRHATFDVQSQRYVDFSSKEDPVVEPLSLVDPDHATRSGEVGLDEEQLELYRAIFESTNNDAFEYYKEMVDEGIPKEDARFMLPVGTKVNMTLTVNARTMLHIANLRERANSQWEIRELTNKIIDEEFADWMPVTYELWREHGPTQISP